MFVKVDGISEEVTNFLKLGGNNKMYTQLPDSWHDICNKSPDHNCNTHKNSILFPQRCHTSNFLLQVTRTLFARYLRKFILAITLYKATRRKRKTECVRILRNIYIAFHLFHNLCVPLCSFFLLWPHFSRLIRTDWFARGFGWNFIHSWPIRSRWVRKKTLWMKCPILDMAQVADFQ